MCGGHVPDIVVDSLLAMTVENVRHVQSHPSHPCNGGQRGLQVRLAPADVRDVAKAVVADVLA